MRKLSVIVCTLLLSGAAYAQNMTVRGKVTANGEELPGVTVTVKGSGGGTITSLDGDYSIKADAGSILVFSFIGYETVEIPVKGNGPINVELREKTTDLDEVVIAVPYGTAKKSSFTGSAGVVDRKIIANSQVASVSKALQGSVAGLQSFSLSGQPGEDATIIIRGVGSVNASTTPLYVVDGVPYDGALSSISNHHRVEGCGRSVALWLTCSQRRGDDYHETGFEILIAQHRDFSQIRLLRPCGEGL